MLLRAALRLLWTIYVHSLVIHRWLTFQRTWNTGHIQCRRNHINEKVLKTWAAHLMGAVLNTCSYIFTEKSVTQFWLVWKNQFYISSISTGSRQEKTSLVFGYSSHSAKITRFYYHCPQSSFKNLKSNSYQKTWCSKLRFLFPCVENIDCQTRWWLI